MVFWIIYDGINNLEKNDSLYKEANRAFLKSNFKKSYKIYKDIYETEKIENLFALEGMARSLTRLERYNEAEKLFLEVIKKDDKFFLAYANLGILYDTIGKHDKALYYYKITIINEDKIVRGMSWFNRFLRNIQFKPSTILERHNYLQQKLLNNDKGELRLDKIDKIQPDFEM